MEPIKQEGHLVSMRVIDTVHVHNSYMMMLMMLSYTCSASSTQYTDPLELFIRNGLNLCTQINLYVVTPSDTR